MMKVINVTVSNESGLTSRLAAELVAEANRYLSKITMVVDKEDTSKQADLKSIMNVFTLSIPYKSSFDIEIEGSDEDKAYDGFKILIKALGL